MILFVLKEKKNNLQQIHGFNSGWTKNEQVSGGFFLPWFRSDQLQNHKRGHEEAERK